MRALLLTLFMLIGACADTGTALRYEVNGIDTGRVWPAPQTREIPRYRLAGQLFGEPNFASPDGAARGAMTKAFRWIVGLDERTPNPVVLQRPQSGLVDEKRRVLVTDISRQAVFVFDEAASKLAVWEMATKTAHFVAPIAIAAGVNGEVLVTDAELKRVFRLNAAGEAVSDFGAGILQRPTGIARDAVRGQIFVTDTHAHDIKVFDDAGRLLRTLGRPGTDAGELNYPTHLAFANDKLYVTDTMNARIQVFDSSGNALMQIGQRGLYLGNLVHPKGVAVDSDGNVYVIESYHDHVLVFDKAGRMLMAIGGTGKANGEFYLPAGVWTDRDNRVFVADMFNGRVVIFQFLGGD